MGVHVHIEMRTMFDASFTFEMERHNGKNLDWQNRFNRRFI